MDKFVKVTTGFVCQTFEKNESGLFVCTGQEFIASDECQYEDLDGEVLDTVPEYEYQPYNMILEQKRFDLAVAANRVIENWESGDLAGAVRQMAAILAQLDAASEGEQNRYTVFGYHTEHHSPFARWVAADNEDEARAVIGRQEPAVVVCGVVQGWIPLN